MGTAQVPGREVNFFFTTFQGLEFDGYLYVKIPEILLSLLVRFVNTDRSGATSSSSRREWEPFFLESSYGYILPERICGSSQQRLHGSSSGTNPKGQGGNPLVHVPPTLS